MSRKDILRGVYEENKRIKAEGRSGPGRASRYGRGVGPGGLALTVVLVVVAGLVFWRDASRRVDPDKAVVSPDARFEMAVPGDSMLGELKLPAGMSLEELTSSAVPVADLFDLGVRTIVIDAGHGGRDSGAESIAGLQEKEITIDVARRLARRLKRYGVYDVMMTRVDDTMLTLRDRVEFSNESGADIFVSIHVNWFPSDAVYALETYYFGGQADSYTLRLAERENRNSDYTVAEFNSLMSSMSDRMKGEESRRLALAVQRSMIRNTRLETGPVENWGIKSGPFVVLVGTEAPGILAEIGVISNGPEAARLATVEYRERLALYLEEGIINYLNQMASDE